MLLGLCIALWRLPATIETFAGTLGSGGTAKDSLLSAMGVATGLGSASAAEREKKTVANPKVIAAGGKPMTQEESDRLMQQARAMAPLPLDGAKDKKTGAPKSPQEAAEEIQRQIDEALKGTSSK